MSKGNALGDRMGGFVRLSALTVLTAGFIFSTVVCDNMPPSGGNDNTASNENNNSNPAPRCNPGTAAGETTVSYERDIVPLFAIHNCLTSACHAGVFNSSGYDLSTYEGVFGPGAGAQQFDVCDVVPGDPEASYLMEKLGPNPRSGLRMPELTVPLTEEEMNLVNTWIAEGAQNN